MRRAPGAGHSEGAWEEAQTSGSSEARPRRDSRFRRAGGDRQAGPDARMVFCPQPSPSQAAGRRQRKAWKRAACAGGGGWGAGGRGMARPTDPRGVQNRVRPGKEWVAPNWARAWKS